MSIIAKDIVGNAVTILGNTEQVSRKTARRYEKSGRKEIAQVQNAEADVCIIYMGQLIGVLETLEGYDLTPE